MTDEEDKESLEAPSKHAFRDIPQVSYAKEPEEPSVKQKGSGKKRGSKKSRQKQ